MEEQQEPGQKQEAAADVLPPLPAPAAGYCCGVAVLVCEFEKQLTHAWRTNAAKTGTARPGPPLGLPKLPHRLPITSHMSRWIVAMDD